MNIEVASWIVFATFLFTFITGYYAANSRASMRVLLPVGIAWSLKTLALIGFGIYYNLWGFFAIACLDLFTLILSMANINKESK
jgi:hypothetical protein